MVASIPARLEGAWPLRGDLLAGWPMRVMVAFLMAVYLMRVMLVFL